MTLYTSSSGVVVLLLLSWILVHRCYIRYTHLRQFDGPRLASWSRYWLIKTYASGESADRFLEVNEKYGKIARVGPNHLLTNDPDVNWRIQGPHSSYLRGPWFDSLRFDPHYTSIASERDPVKHDALRRKVAAGYATKEFPDLEAVLDRRVATWISSLSRHVTTSKVPSNGFDIGRSVRLATLDMAAFVCFSRDLMFGEAEADEFWDDMEANAPYAQYLSTLHWLFGLTYYLTSFSWFKQHMLLTEHNNPGIGRILRVSRVATAERYGRDAKNVNDMLGSWVKKGLTQHEAETEVSIALVTGAFPTAVAINVAILHVCTNIRIYRILRAELDSFMERRSISGSLTYEETLELPYFQACVNEALRLYPPITQLRERIVPPGGDTIDGHFVAGGTNIGINARGMLRDACFGPHPEMFRPERWLEADEGRLKQMKKVHSLIFGAGSTKCLGMLQASMIINKSLLELLRRYDVEILNPANPWRDQSSGVSFHSNFFVNLHERDTGLGQERTKF